MLTFKCTGRLPVHDNGNLWIILNWLTRIYSSLTGLMISDIVYFLVIEKESRSQPRFQQERKWGQCFDLLALSIKAPLRNCEIKEQSPVKPQIESFLPNNEACVVMFDAICVAAADRQRRPLMSRRIPHLLDTVSIRGSLHCSMLSQLLFSNENDCSFWRNV